MAEVARGSDDDITEGILHCSNPGCRREYPIIDGIPLIIGPLRDFVAENIQWLTARRDLSTTMESLLGDCCGPNSAFDNARRHVSSYAWDHYGDLDPDEPERPEDHALRPGSALRVLDAAAELLGGDLAEALPDGPIIDLGCSTGRTAQALAERTGRTVLGVDLHIPSVRLAAAVMRDGVVSYPRRRLGLVYDRRQFAADLPRRDHVDIWVCDAAALPFDSETFAACVGLNLLDSVNSPIDLLRSMNRILKDDGVAIMASPYEWTEQVTPIAAWVGGHSQRGDDRGSSATIVRQLLTPGALPSSVDRLQLVGEAEEVPWHVRTHER
ncbi:MAG: methyltransferase domain-containing protein, partial [Myxococcota bacterium]